MDFAGIFNSLIHNWKATLFLAGIIAIAIVTLILFIKSIKAQKAYDNAALPILPGMMDDDEGLEVVEESHDEDIGSAFDLDDESLSALPNSGDKEAEDLLKAARAASEKPKKSPLSLFQKNRK